MRAADWIVALLLLVMTLHATFVEHQRRQPRTPPIVGWELPPPAIDDPISEVPPDREVRSSRGSAFLVNTGLWLTAGHVAQGCTRIVIRDGNAPTWATVAWRHPGADLAFLDAGQRSTPLRFSRDPLVAGQDGFAMGFPQGEPGAVHGRLIERTRLRMRDTYAGSAATLDWAEVSRFPPGLKRISGASGSPMLNERGHVIGVLVAGQPRRGRFKTTTLENFGPDAADVPSILWAGRGARLEDVDAGNFVAVSDRLRGTGQIVEVICHVSR